jgi:hypothetical protein
VCAVLHGTFETLTISELLRTLAGAGKTGALELSAGDVEGRIHLVDGRCRAAGSATLADPLDSDVALEARLVELCFAVARAPEGDFRFFADEAAPWTTAVGVELDGVLTEVERQLDQWREIQAVIPSLDAHPHLRDELEAESLTVDPALWRLLVAIDGRRSVREVIDRTRQGVLDVCHALKGLVDQGAVVIDPPTARATTRSRTGTGARTGTAKAAGVARAAVRAAEPAPRAPAATEPRGTASELTDPWGPDLEAPEPPDDDRQAAALRAEALLEGDAGVRDRRALLRLFSALREG